MNTNTNTEIICRRCRGTGRLPRFSHVDGGLCFHCQGAGVVEAPEGSPVRPVVRTEALRRDWRTRYRNARAGLLSYEDMIDPDLGGHTPEGVIAALDALEAREAFRALGWPV